MDTATRAMRAVTVDVRGVVRICLGARIAGRNDGVQRQRDVLRRLARHHASHCNEREKANEKEATKDSHVEQTDARIGWIRSMITHATLRRAPRVRICITKQSGIILSA